MGSVVLDRIAAEAALVAGFPARAGPRHRRATLAAGRYRFSKEDWGPDAS